MHMPAVAALEGCPAGAAYIAWNLACAQTYSAELRDQTKYVMAHIRALSSSARASMLYLCQTNVQHADVEQHGLLQQSEESVAASCAGLQPADWEQAYIPSHWYLCAAYLCKDSNDTTPIEPKTASARTIGGSRQAKASTRK